VHQQQDVEVAADQRHVRGSGQSQQLLAHRPPGVLHDLQRDVGGSALTCAFLVDAGAEAADDAVVDEAVDPRVGIGPRDVHLLRDGPDRRPAVRAEQPQDGPVDGIERPGRRTRNLALGHLSFRHALCPLRLDVLHSSNAGATRLSTDRRQL